MMQQTMQRRTKIVCTMGPACAGDMIGELIQAGMNVARLNFSHGTQADHGELISKIRQLAQMLHRPVGILMDLAGPKIRVGEFSPEPVNLSPGQTFMLTRHPVVGTAEQCSVNYPEVIDAVPVDATILLADGTIELTVTDKTPEALITRVVVGGTLSSRKGLNLPSLSLPIPSVTDKDISDLHFGLEKGVDFVGLSYVRSRDDVEYVKDLIHRQGFDTPVIAKIENQAAVNNVNAILMVADGIMVARGDLGVETPLEKVPLVQKRLIEAANAVGKPVITATQMLASMVTNPRPSRAEATDVANAILDGTDAIMLSEETATGRYPREAVRFMHKIAHATEASIPFEEWVQSRARFRGTDISDAISHAAVGMAVDLNARAILATTESGGTARLISRFRPRVPIIGITCSTKTLRRLILSWGVEPLLVRDLKNTDYMLELVKNEARRAGWVAPGDRVIITAGNPIGMQGTTNLIKADIIE